MTKLHEIYCAGCRCAFFSSNPRQKYCDNACKQLGYRQRKKMHRKTEQDMENLMDAILFRIHKKRCAYCGESLTWSGKGRKPKYCSASCRTMAYRQREKRSNSDFDNVLMWQCAYCGQKQFVEPSSACEFCHGDNWQAVKLSGRADF